MDLEAPQTKISYNGGGGSCEPVEPHKRGVGHEEGINADYKCKAISKYSREKDTLLDKRTLQISDCFGNSNPRSYSLQRQSFEEEEGREGGGAVKEKGDPILDFTCKMAKTESRGEMIERKMEFLESLAGKVSNRRSRRWINDRLLVELVPRLNADEIRGLFAPPPWGDYTPPSAFTMANCPEWDPFININMDVEVHMIAAMGNTIHKRENHMDSDKVIALSAWHRVDRRTREALRQNFHLDFLQRYEDCIRDFVHSTENEVLLLHVQDPFRRLLLHGVCKFYDLISNTETVPNDSKELKVTRIRRRKMGSQEVPPHITLVGYLKMAKNGVL